jgi:hypothetical protein
MKTIERCLNQLISTEGYMPGKSHYGNCNNCLYNPEENKQCLGYKPKTYEIPD